MVDIRHMRAFAEAWPDGLFVQKVLAQLPWYHQRALFDKLTTETTPTILWTGSQGRQAILLPAENQPDQRGTSCKYETTWTTPTP